MSSPYKIPPDIYERVHEALVAIANAVEIEDNALWQTEYEQFSEFCEQQTTAGRGSGFMWEAMGDVTIDPRQRLICYERSIGWGRFNSEPIQTALLAIAEIYGDEGNWKKAELFLEQARQEAIKNNDLGTEGEVASLLLQLPSTDL